MRDGKGQKSEIGYQMSKVRSQRSEIRSRMSESGEQKSDVGERRAEGLSWKIVHTGQHYDYEMSLSFFDELRPLNFSLFKINV